MTKDEALRIALEALRFMHDEKCDYMFRNKLGNPLHETSARMALRAIAAIDAAMKEQADKTKRLRAERDALQADANRWRMFISLPYRIRREWASNLSLSPVLTEWVDNALRERLVDGENRED